MTQLIQDAARVDEGFTDARGARFGWTRAGSGPLAVYAHALSHDRDSLAGTGALLDLSPVNHIRTLVRYDARGHGRSTGTLSAADYSYPELAADLLSLGSLWSPSAPITGLATSMGTATLLHAATREPGRFDRLVLTAPPTAWEGRDEQAEAYNSLAEAVEDNGLDSMMDALKAAATPAIMRGAPQLEPRVAEAVLPTILRGMATSNLPEREAIAGLRMPVLILSWSDDATHPVATGQKLHDLIPGSEFSVAQSRAEVGRWPYAIAEFLRG